MAEQKFTPQVYVAHFLPKGDGPYCCPAETISVKSQGELHEKFLDMISRKVDDVYEIRVVDSDDYIVFEVKDKELIYPLVGKVKPGNRWFHEHRAFVNKEDFASAEANALIKRASKAAKG